MDSALGKCDRVKVQAVTRDVSRQLGKDRAGAASHLEHAMGLIQFDLVEDVSPQITSPFGLLGVACMPVHNFIALSGTSFDFVRRNERSSLRSGRKYPWKVVQSKRRLSTDNFFPIIFDEVPENFVCHALRGQNIAVGFNIHPGLARAFRDFVFLCFERDRVMSGVGDG